MAWFPVVVSLFSLISMVCTVSGIGANWGTQATHRLPPDTVVRLLKQNGIQKVKLFDADYDTLRSLSRSEIEVMVGIPNDMLASLASSVKAAEKWVTKNVSTHISSNNVNIRYVTLHPLLPLPICLLVLIKGFSFLSLMFNLLKHIKRGTVEC